MLNHMKQEWKNSFLKEIKRIRTNLRFLPFQLNIPVICFFSTTIFSLVLSPTVVLKAQEADVKLPFEMAREIIIHHKAYSLSYNTSYALPSWVSYKVTKAQVNKEAPFKGKYKKDPLVTVRAADKKDYKNSGYLMAQLVNYLDVLNIETAAEETFYMSNIVPMKLAFHRHIWLGCEDLIRMWVANSDGLYIITGPIIEADAPFPTMGENKISVPNRYYKIVYDEENKKAIGFIFKNGTSSGTLKSYSRSVDEIEKLTGIDFFPELDETTSKNLESAVDYDFWDFELEDNL
jgi:endonuclease G